MDSRELALVERRLLRYVTRDVPAARATAIRQSLNLVRTQVVRKVAQKNQLPSRPVRQRVVIPRARRGKNPFISMYRHDVPLIVARARQTRRGVSAGRRRVAGGFIATIRRTGKQHVFRRESADRYPLETQRVSIRQSVNRYLPVIARRVFRERYNQLYQRELNRRAGRG